MSERLSRRAAVRRAMAGGTALGLGAASAFATSRVGAADPEAQGDAAVSQSPVESLVRLMITTPREQVSEVTAQRIRDGAGYRDVLAALLLAGVREVEPRPTVGYQFHTVLAVISYHLLGTELSPRDRWLPLFWGIDYFKRAQARDAAQGDWTLGEVARTDVPAAEHAGEALAEAMRRWDEPAADAAAVAVAAHMRPSAAFELFYPLGARDFRSIGHKAIFVMCADRTLRLIGWDHAQPVLRSLAYALLMHEDGNPADRDAPADRPWRRNKRIVDRIRADWSDGQPSTGATTELLAVLRNGSHEDAADVVIDRLNAGASPTSLWDGIFCGAAELQLRLPNIVSLHAATTTRAIHHAFGASRRDRTRRLLLLQNAAMIPLFRDAAAGRGRLDDAAIDRLDADVPDGSDEAAVRVIVGELGGQRRAGARKILGYLESGRPAEPLVSAIRDLVAVKGDGAHDFKFTSAALENFRDVSPVWRARYLACGAMHFRGPDEPDSPVVQRTRAAFGAV